MRTPSTEVEKRILATEGDFSVRSMLKDLLDAGCQVSWSRVAEAIDRLCLAGEITRFPTAVNGRPYRVQPSVPHTPCSVVWFDGHPFVLDGEPGMPTPRRWVGIGRDGQPKIIDHDTMTQYGPAVIYRDRFDA